MSEPQEGTFEYWQNMERNLLECIQNILGSYGIPIQDELPWSDIDKIVNDVDSHEDPMEAEFATHLANLQVCAIEKYKLQHNINAANIQG